MNNTSKVDAKSTRNDAQSTPGELRIRIGVSRKPVKRQSPNGAHWKIEHRTLDLSELVELIQSGHALGAICAGYHSYENFIGRQEIQLDIDADLSNPLPYYMGDRFFIKYGFLAYTTNTPGHCRLVFRLSKQITNPVEYFKYAQALAQMFGADMGATSPAQLWFTYPGCDVAIVGNTLPVEVVSDLARALFDSDDYEPPPPSADPDTLLQLAIDAGQPGNRHNAGLELAMQLRRLNLPFELAEAYLRRYQKAVAWRGEIAPYTDSEALATLRGVYRHRKHIDSGIIEQVRQAVFDGSIRIEKSRTDKNGEIVTEMQSMPVNVRRTFFAILEAMQQVGRTVNVKLSVRQICRAASWHISKDAVIRHIAVLKGAGLLRVFSGGSGRASAYSLTWHPVSRGGYRDNETQQEGYEGEGNSLSNPYPSCCVSKARLVTTFRELQHSAAAEPGAKIHPQLTTTEDDYLVRLGSSAQAVIAALESCDNETADSIKDLQTLAGLSWRCTSTAVKSLADVGIVEINEVKTAAGKAKIIRLLPMWREKLQDTEPLLTTYGRDILRSKQYLDQRKSYHQHKANHAKSDDERARHDAEVERAIGERFVNDIQHAAAMDARREAAQGVGLTPDKAPAISLTNERRQQKKRQPVVEHKNGRFISRELIPATEDVSGTLDPDGKFTLTNSATTRRNREITREWLEKLGLSAPSKPQQQFERLTLGHVGSDDFGTVERIEVQQ